MHLLKLSKKFCKLASLKSDMANRIMYGITQSMTDTVDYPALEIAVAGAKDIIKYGVDACYDELENYRGYTAYGRLQDYSAYKNNKVELNTLPTFILYLELFEEFFNDDENWGADYGGKAWANIAKTLKIVAENYLKYLSTPKYSKENLQAANDVLIYTNVFDGMAHNTYGVYSSLIIEEFKDKGIKTNIKDLEELMDSKELTDPVDTYNIVKKDLGIDLPYKDYIQKLRQDPEFFNRDPVKIKKEISGVSFIRKIKQDFYEDEHLSELLQRVEELSGVITNDCNYLNNNYKPDDSRKLAYLISDFYQNVNTNVRDMFNKYIINFNYNLRNLAAESEKNESELANKIKEQLKQVYDIGEYRNRWKGYIELELKKLSEADLKTINADNIKNTTSKIQILTKDIVDSLKQSMDDYKAIRDSI